MSKGSTLIATPLRRFGLVLGAIVAFLGYWSLMTWKMFHSSMPVGQSLWSIESSVEWLIALFFIALLVIVTLIATAVASLIITAVAAIVRWIATGSWYNGDEPSEEEEW